MMRTGEQYLQSLRDGRRVMCGGELIEDITTHPKTSGYASQVAEFYDLHLDPKHQEHLTYIDEDGVRRAKHWMMPKNKEQAVERREYFDYIFRHFRGGQWSRLPCSNNTVCVLSSCGNRERSEENTATSSYIPKNFDSKTSFSHQRLLAAR